VDCISLYENYIDDIIIEGDKVAGIYNLNWHNKDEFIDLQPTNKSRWYDSILFS
jgi:hypothetical protein